MSTPSSTPRQPGFGALYSTAADWARTDGLTWIYLFKALAACFLALGIAIKLDLPKPRTAMTTVFIVMQPQSGMVFAKILPDLRHAGRSRRDARADRPLFAATGTLHRHDGIWVGICTAGAARNRNFRSYGFVLAGYTAALIGIPASQYPDGAVLTRGTRVAEVVVGSSARAR